MISQAVVQAKLNQWEMGNGMHFCSIMQRGGTWEYVQYPTGLIMMKASLGNEQTEIHLPTAKRIKQSNWTISY